LAAKHLNTHPVSHTFHSWPSFITLLLLLLLLLHRDGKAQAA
jgi:hypothetical protein